jgi:hypothetical protein
MNLLDELLKKKIRLIDYELLYENSQRTVRSGPFAGKRNIKPRICRNN